MKQSFYFICFLLMLSSLSSAQTIKDVLMDGIPLKEDKKLIFFLDKTGDNVQLKYYMSEGNNATYKVFEDSSLLFLSQERTVNVYSHPVNPLNYSYKTKIEFVVDQIDQDAQTALTTIANTVRQGLGAAFAPVAPSNYATLKSAAEEMEKKVNKDFREEINAVFTKMKALDFESETATINALAKIQTEIDGIKVNFTTIKESLDGFKKKIEDYQPSGGDPDEFIVRNVFTKIYQDLSKVYEAHLTRLTALESIYKMLEEVQIEAGKKSKHGGLEWVVPLDLVPVKVGKISVYSFTVYKSGYELRDKEIKKSDEKVLLSKLVRFRRFARIIPKVSVGVAYTNLRFPTFSTIADSTGQHYVAAGKDDVVRKVNFSTMINFLYYYPQAYVHPFIQVGVGINASYPTLLAGAGIELNAGSFPAIAISGGIASSWAKQLSTLKLNDKVAGPAEVDKDLKYEFNWPPRFYFGIQVNLK